MLRLILCILGFFLSFRKPTELILEKRFGIFSHKVNSDYYGGSYQQTKHRFIINGYVQTPTFLYKNKVYDQHRHRMPFAPVTKGLIKINNINYKLTEKSISALRSVKDLEIISMDLVNYCRWNVEAIYKGEPIRIACNIGIPDMRKFVYLWNKYKFNGFIDLRFDNFMLYDDV